MRGAIVFHEGRAVVCLCSLTSRGSDNLAMVGVRYEHLSRVRSHRDAVCSMLKHTWELLQDVAQLAMLHGGLSGRTRSRHVETLIKVSSARSQCQLSPPSLPHRLGSLQR